MEKRAWLLALGAVALIGTGVVVWMNDDTRAGTSAAAGDASQAGRASHGGRIGGGDGFASGSAAERARAIDADAGVLARVPRLANAPAEPGEGSARGRDDELPRNAADADRSSGWRLGQTRRRMAILTPRIERLRGMVETLEQQGNAELAARQRAVLERTERRMNELREEETELATAAQADGTMGEVDQGYEEGETDADGARGTANARLPPPTEE